MHFVIYYIELADFLYIFNQLLIFEFIVNYFAINRLLDLSSDHKAVDRWCLLSNTESMVLSWKSELHAHY